MKTMAKMTMAGLVVLASLSTAAWAQRDPAYAAARAAGEVGELPDGYLGVVGGGSAELRAPAYTQKAQATGATVEQLAFTSGCNLIAQTKPGEKYRAPDGGWKTRTAAAPERDPRCV